MIYKTLAIRAAPRFSWAFSTAVAALVFAMTAASGWVWSRQNSALQQLAAFDLERSLIVSAHLPPGATLQFTKKPTGLIEDFLMTRESLDGLTALPAVESVHEYREQTLEATPNEGAPHDVRLSIVPAGFLSAHHLGRPEADDRLNRGCIVIDADTAQRWAWKDPQKLLIRSTKADREGIARVLAKQGIKNLPDDGRIDSDACVLPLTLPRGIAVFENTLFISAEHPALQGRTTFSKPLLWVSVKRSLSPEAGIAAVTSYVTNVAVPSQPKLQLHVQRFGMHSGDRIVAADVSRWALGLKVSAAVAGVSGLLALLFLRWQALRKELTLRQVLGQTLRVSIHRTLHDHLWTAAVGVIIGTLLSLIGAAMLWRQGWQQYLYDLGSVGAVVGLDAAILILALFYATKLDPAHTLKDDAR